MSDIPEQAGKVASSAIEAFRNNPACLAAVILAAIFAILTYFAMQRDADRRARTVDMMIDRCYPYLEEHRNREMAPGVGP